MQWNWLTGRPTTLGGLEETRITRCMCRETSFVFVFYLFQFNLWLAYFKSAIAAQSKEFMNRKCICLLCQYIQNTQCSNQHKHACLVLSFLSPCPCTPRQQIQLIETEKKKMTAYLWHCVILTRGWQTEDCCLRQGQPSPSQCSKGKKSIYS